ncbi:heavy metal sensor histidine kinase [Providencia stuartii]|uniref:Sensor protein n=4 Tax=Gammaproteobacteria TaxID=1236 RepID=A0AAI9DAU9_PROST|nr:MULTISPECIES: heavy metal sensor histidine kinase [Providencia]QQO62049.1 heavy metal sensor histidine kinase [Providencia manganoxydans]ELR5112369.1 heavy metal sensor histidine kinase [Providencia stuartii]ELR5299283.1 heavy metal sensor histidine kinase [Providencia stuartii]MDW7588356.1 heavy metal sensor histidine kinase [Providencia sp. 2023EL-00965]HEF8773244.1 heavy metal sensor histidine kinase [Providencia stuartii]
MKKKSLRFQLILSFILLMIVNAGLVTWVLYHSLKNELIERDDNLLINRTDQLAKLIASGIDIKTLPMYFQRMMDMRQDIIQIKNAENQIIVATNADMLASGHLKLVQLETLDSNNISHWRTSSGIPISAVNFNIDSPIGRLNIVLAKASVDRDSVLAKYLTQSLVISLISIILMGLLSLWLIKKGLRDIQFLSQTTANTDLQSLNHSIEIAQLPKELKELGESLNIMRSRLKGDFVKLTQLADDLAHELRTPINAIRVQNEIVLQRSRSVSEYESVIASNIEELDKLAQIIQSILFIARAENRNIALKREVLPLFDLVNEVYELFSVYAEEKNIVLLCHPSKLSLNADRVLLVRVLINVISNAVKYAQPHTQVITNISAKHNTLSISIVNHGEVLPDSEEIFTRFWRGDNSRTSEGSGLGLSIVKAIIELHGGCVAFRHQAGQSTLILNFPYDND